MVPGGVVAINVPALLCIDVEYDDLSPQIGDQGWERPSS
jgi:hypothetical protein